MPNEIQKLIIRSSEPKLIEDSFEFAKEAAKTAKDASELYSAVQDKASE